MQVLTFVTGAALASAVYLTAAAVTRTAMRTTTSPRYVTLAVVAATVVALVALIALNSETVFTLGFVTGGLVTPPMTHLIHKRS